MSNRPASLREFHARFPDDAACAERLLDLRYPDGYVCRQCGSRTAWPVSAKPGTMVCNKGHKMSITAGTTLHRTRQPLTAWFDMVWLMITNKSGISALQLQRQLGLTREETTSMMMHKMRSALWDPHRSKLEGHVEVDEVYIGGAEEGEEHRGRGSDTKTLVAIAVEVREWTNKKGKVATKAGRCRMEVVPDASGKSLVPFVLSNISQDAGVHTDSWGGYNALTEHGYGHSKIVAKVEKDPLPTHGRVVTNLKRVMIGTYKGAVHGHHLQGYLNEYVFRFNRRHWPWAAFDRALSLAMIDRDRPEYKTLYSGDWKHRTSTKKKSPRVPADEINKAIERRLQMMEREGAVEGEGE